MTLFKTKNLSEKISSSQAFVFPILIALLVGSLTGFTAVGYIKLIDVMERFYYGPFSQLFSFLGNFRYIFIPMLASLMAGIWLCVIMPQAKGPAVPMVLKSLLVDRGKMHPLVIPGKTVGTAMALGGGASVGREGPIVQIGAAIGSNIARFFKLSELRTRNFIACGAAAGIATVFNAPITGVMYSLEIILKDFGARALATVVIASVISSVICRAFLGSTPAFFAPSYALVNPSELFIYFLLGLASGFTALVFNFCLNKSNHFFTHLRTAPWLKPALGGLFIGLLGAVSPQNLGTGFSTIEQVLAGDFPAKFLLFLVATKIIGSSVSLGSNTPGGLFGPTLFIGAMLGGAIGHTAHHFVHFPMAPSGAYALAAMASVFAGSAHAPLTAMFLVFELTDNYHMILPVMTSVVVATSISQWLFRDSMDALELKHLGLDISALEGGQVLGTLEVRDAMSTQFEVVSPALDMKTVLEKAEKNHNLVVMNEKEFVGIITLEQLRHDMLDENVTILNAGDLAMNISLYCHPEEPLSEAGRLMMAHGLSSLPVVEASNPNHVLGIIKSEDVFLAYTKLASKKSLLENRLDAYRPSGIESTAGYRFSIPPRSPLVGKTLRDLTLPEGVILTSIFRDKISIIVKGSAVFKAKDKVWAVVDSQHDAIFKKWLDDNKLKLLS